MLRSEALARAKALAEEGAGLLVAIPLWTWWAVWKGGYPPAVFLGGIGYLALAALALRLFAPRPRLGRGPALALGFLAALTAWTIASLLWADDRGAVEVSAARQVLLLGSFALPVVWAPSARALLVGVAALPLIALAGAVSAIGGALGDVGSLTDGRLAGPTGYPNASAALMAIGFLPAVVLGSRREQAIWLRVLMLAAAGALLGAFVLTQSRGGLVALSIVLLLAVALVPGRLRLAIAIGLVVACTAAALGPLLEVRSAAVEGGDVAEALRSAAAALITATVVIAGLGAVYAGVDSRIEVSPTVVRRASTGIAAALGGAALVAAVLLLASGPDVGAWVSDRVDDFKTADYEHLESQPTRFTGDLGSNRYDYWRVSVDVFAEKPLVGNGAGNFIAPFLERRTADKSTIYAHSIWLGSLAQLGAIGFMALLGFLAGLAFALVRSARVLDRRRWLVVAAGLPLAYLLVQGTIDWIDAFPIVIAPAFALAGAAAGVGGREQLSARTSGALSLALVTSLVAATAFAAPQLVAARLADRAAAGWQTGPKAAIDDLRRAADLDPLSATPHLRLGIVGVELERPALAREAFESALERDNAAWYPELQLGLLAAEADRRARSLFHLRLALERNPREVEVHRALRAVRSGKGAVDPRAVQRRVLGRPTE